MRARSCAAFTTTMAGTRKRSLPTPSSATAAAAVVGTAAGKTPWHVTATGSCLLPDSADAMTWTIGDHGFEMTLSQAGSGADRQALPALAGEAGWPSTTWRWSRWDSWAIHPGGPSILGAVEEAAGLARDGHGGGPRSVWPSTATCRRRRSCSFSIGCAHQDRAATVRGPGVWARFDGRGSAAALT